MKIALVHDQLHDFGGAERVLFALKKIYPNAPVYTSFCTFNTLHKIHPDSKSWDITQSWVARIPFIRKLYSPLRFLAPLIWESFDFSSFDVVISSSGWYMSKGIITRPECKHYCYLHHQPRFLYYYETSIEWQKYLPIKIYSHIVNHFLRMWDYLASQRPDIFIANSQETQKRIQKFYRRDSVVIYPPVEIPIKFDLDTKTLSQRKTYITLSRLVKTKNIDLLIRVANKLKLHLKIIGTGRDEAYLKSIAGSSVEFLGRVADDEFLKLYSSCKAFLNASVDEEFGISPIEAMSYGVPVIAYASGGLKETVQEGYNGYLFNMLDDVSLTKLIQKMERLDKHNYEILCHNARKSSEKYSFEKFKKQIFTLVQ